MHLTFHFSAYGLRLAHRDLGSPGPEGIASSGCTECAEKCRKVEGAVGIVGRWDGGKAFFSMYRHRASCVDWRNELGIASGHRTREPQAVAGPQRIGQQIVILNMAA